MQKDSLYSRFAACLCCAVHVVSREVEGVVDEALRGYLERQCWRFARACMRNALLSRDSFGVRWARLSPIAEGEAKSPSGLIPCFFLDLAMRDQKEAEEILQHTFAHYGRVFVVDFSLAERNLELPAHACLRAVLALLAPQMAKRRQEFLKNGGLEKICFPYPIRARRRLLGGTVTIALIAEQE